MSLIMDALKKAQQLKMKEGKGVPFSQRPPLRNKRSASSSSMRWIVIGTVLGALIILLLVLRWPTSLPPIKSDQASIPAAAKRPEEPLKKMSKGPSKEIAGLPKEAGSPSKDTLSLSKQVSQPKEVPGLPKEPLSGSKGLTKESTTFQKVTPAPPKETLSPSKEEKTKEPLVTEAEGRKSIRTRPEKRVDVKLGPSIHTPVAQKEKVTTMGEEEKSRTPTPEVLTHFNLGVSFFNQRELVKAIQAYQKAIALDPTYVEAYNNLGIAYQELGDSTKAFDAYRKSVETNPQYEKGYNNLGILLYRKGRNEEAIEAFQKAIAINPNNVESHINLGVLFKKRGQWDKGIESYEKALAISPGRGETHYNIALLYEQLGKADLAIDHYRRFVQLSSSAYPELTSRVQSHLNRLSADRKD